MREPMDNCTSADFGKMKGFTLMEVLITVLVLSIGLLGLASLQGLGLRNNNSAYMRSQATVLAADMADRIRSNPTALADYATIDSTANQSAYTDPGCISTGCSATNLAKYDAYAWTNPNSPTSIASLLPSGRGKVTSSGNIFTITVMWDDYRTGATGTGCGGDPQTDLTCFKLRLQP